MTDHHPVLLLFLARLSAWVFFIVLFGSFHTSMAPTSSIRLDQFLKLIGAVDTGGQAKIVIQDGQVMVNGEVETRRRRQLEDSDQIRIGDQKILVSSYVSE